MSVKRCNIEGVMDALFREFLSQPGERQYCSELLRSIAKGKFTLIISWQNIYSYLKY